MYIIHEGEHFEKCRSACVANFKFIPLQYTEAHYQSGDPPPWENKSFKIFIVIEIIFGGHFSQKWHIQHTSV
jgi:hypothetical protein